MRNQHLYSPKQAQLAEATPVNAPAVLTIDAEEVIRSEEEVYTDSRGKRMRRVRVTRNMIRRTFLKGKLRGKYWGYPVPNGSRPEDAGDFYDIQIYESEIVIGQHDIVTDKRTNYQDLITEFSRKYCCEGQQIGFNQFSENILILDDGNSALRYKIDLYEPTLFNPKLIHALHQSNGAEVFGTVESPICGYLVDYVEEVEETVEEFQEWIQQKPPLSPPLPPQPPEPTGVMKKETDQQPVTDYPVSWSLEKTASLLALLLLLGLAGLLLLRFQLPGILVLAVAALALFAIRPALKNKTPWWLPTIIVLLLILLIWNILWHTPPRLDSITETFSGTTPPNVGDEPKNTENQGSNQSKINKNKPGSDNIQADKPDNINTPKPTQTDPVKPIPNTAEESDIKPVPTPLPPPRPAPSQQSAASFEMFLNRGLKAVQDEEYALANENFRQAARLAPGNRRLMDLAASYKALADQKCREFKQADARNLTYIPNNYYQYAASLTQTVPLKCD
ncbi:hypothetical protein [Dyadobacter sp. OTU695]|uniref:hypothetical protein n=1 Tax=Dyadobacter sp. OTU695 TaxID=3043860 RepID=UPI00313E48D3